MEFGWSEKESLYCENLLREIDSHLTPLISQRSNDAPFGRNEWMECGRLGLLGLGVPTDYSGAGLSPLFMAKAMETFGLGCPDMGLVFSAAAHLCACVMPVYEFASSDYKNIMLPKLCRGDWIGANAISEESAGSDIYAIQTFAESDGDYYVISGKKSFVTNGPAADAVLVYAKTATNKGLFSISAFIVERGTPGLSFGEPFEKLGLRSVPAGTITFDKCRIHASQRLGEEGQGGVIFNRSMQWERSILFAGYIGSMERQINAVISRAKKRHQFGQKISSFQAISHSIVDMKMRLESARMLLYKACWMLQNNRECTLETSMAKLAVSEACIQSSMDAIQVFGSNGYLSEYGIERGLRDAVAGTIVSGTTQLQREIIARQLGL